MTSNRSKRVSRSRRVVDRRSLRASRCSATKAGQFTGPTAGAVASSSAAAVRPIPRSNIRSRNTETVVITAETQSPRQVIGRVRVVRAPSKSRRVSRTRPWEGATLQPCPCSLLRASLRVPTHLGWRLVAGTWACAKTCAKQCKACRDTPCQISKNGPDALP